MIVELQVEGMQRLARQEIRQARSAELAGLCLPAGEQRAQATLRWAALPRERFAWRAWQSDRLARAFFAQGRQQ